MKQFINNGIVRLVSDKYEQAEKRITPLIQKGILAACDCYISHKTSKEGYDVWDSLIISHDGCRKIAASELLEGKRIDPKGFRSRESTVGYDAAGRPFICVLYEYIDEQVFANGESSELNNSFGYPYAMAYKRCYDRAVLEKSGLSELGIHSREESEDFKSATPMQTASDISASVENPVREKLPQVSNEPTLKNPVPRVAAPVTPVAKPTPKSKSAPAPVVSSVATAADQVVLPAREDTPVMSLEDAMYYSFNSGKIAGMTGEEVMLNPALKVFVTAIGNVKTGAEQAAAKAIAAAM